MNPNVAIVVVNWNCWPDTIECLESLAKLTYRSIDVIVVDNASTADGGAFMARVPEFEQQFPGFLFIQTGANLGYAGGNNRGIRVALERGAEWVLVLNPDTIVPPDLLDVLIFAAGARARGARRFDVAAPKIMDADGRLWTLGNRFNWNLLAVSRIVLNNALPASLAPAPMDYVSGTALLVHRDVFRRIGLIPDVYFLYYEDAEFCIRARRAGYAVGVVPEAAVTHKVSRSTKAGSPLYVYYHFRNSLLFTARTSALWLRLIIYCCSVWWALKQCIKLLIPSRRANGLAGLKGMKDFWLGRFGRQTV